MSPAPDNLAVFNVGTFRGRPQVLEYVCLRTGEILDTKTAQEIGVKAIRPHAMLSRSRKLDGLRKEPQTFARFIIRYRNGRCGFQVPMESLVGMYAKLHGKEAKNVRRYLPVLTEAGILLDEQSLHKDFMINDPTEAKASALGDTERAHCRFAGDMLRRRRKK